MVSMLLCLADCCPRHCIDLLLLLQHASLLRVWHAVPGLLLVSNLIWLSCCRHLSITHTHCSARLHIQLNAIGRDEISDQQGGAADVPWSTAAVQLSF